MNRLDDSIVQVIAGRPMLIRRARGYIPHAVPLPPYLPSSACILAVGGQQKNSFAFSKNQQIYLSQHIGNLDSADTCKVYDQEVEKWEVLLGIVPSLGVGDKHPEFYTTEYLQKREIRSDPVQHHMAHVFAGMLDNQLPPPLFSISWDGTGLGDDRTIWGGEAFIVEEKGIRRFASLFPFKLPGSEKAVREPRRCAWGAMYAAFEGSIPPIYGRWMSEAFSSEELNILPIILAKGINAPSCSSMGRLFDAVSALLGCCLISHFEGQAALALEALASRAENEAQRYALPLLNENGLWLLDWRGMLGHIFEDKIRGRSLAGIALGFHLALVQGIVDLAHIASLENVLLTGGVMQNKLLAENTIARLKQEGFKPFWHHQIPPNDGGLAAGQLAGKIWEGREYVSSIAG
jgi:hydrogenase maturation protein HypF